MACCARCGWDDDDGPGPCDCGDFLDPRDVPHPGNSEIDDHNPEKNMSNYFDEDSYDEFESSYNPSVRCGEPPEESMTIGDIRIGFAIPTHVTSDQKRRLVRLIDEITSSPANQPTDGVHWVAEMGSLLQFSQADAAFLGKLVDPNAPATGEPTFDDSVFSIETCARAFVSRREKGRVQRRRAKEENRSGRIDLWIAIAADDSGNWVASGKSGASKEEISRIALGRLATGRFTSLHWVTAGIYLPTPKEIQGEETE